MAKDKSMMREGSENGRWKGGKSSDYRRRLMKAKPGEIVHHKDHVKSDNKKSNFEVLPNLAAHNRAHPEKGRKRWTKNKK